MTARSSLLYAHVVLVNYTEDHYKFQVQHQYAGNDIEESEWIYVAPGERRKVMDVHYRYGWATNGKSNWKIHGIQLVEVESSTKVPNIISVDGKFFTEGIRYTSWHGIHTGWKIHVLRKEDFDEDIIIRIYPNSVQFICPSGKSATRWDDSTKVIGRVV